YVEGMIIFRFKDSQTMYTAYVSSGSATGIMTTEDGQTGSLYLIKRIPPGVKAAENDLDALGARRQ
ncbi:MAG: hypothetical protein ACLGI9_17685, partial [Thermoanaerobaculia bacterium]